LQGLRLRWLLLWLLLLLLLLPLPLLLLPLVPHWSLHGAIGRAVHGWGGCSCAAVARLHHTAR